MTLKYDHLLGLEFDMERQHCWSLIRQFYSDNWGISLTDYACPKDWWRYGFNLFMDQAEAEGFSPLHCHPRDYRAGDVLLCAIQSSTGNHTAVFLENGKLLHHLVGQRSCITSFGSVFRNTMVGVYRHKDVPMPVETPIDLKGLLPEHARRRLEELAREADTGR